MNTNMKINDYPLITKHKFIYQKTILQNITVNSAM